jgi:hypothetical protein
MRAVRQAKFFAKAEIMHRFFCARRAADPIGGELHGSIDRTRVEVPA